MLKFPKITQTSLYLGFFLLSLVLSYLLIPHVFFFPYTGISLLFIVMTIGVYLGRTEKSTIIKIFFSLCIVLSGFLILRANAFLTLLTILTILYIGSLLTMHGKMRFTLLHVLFSPFMLLYAVVKTTPVFDLPRTRFTLPEKWKRFDQHLPAVALTLLILMVIIPLLSSANPYFNTLIQNTFSFLQKFFSLDWLLKEHVIPFLFRTVTFLILIIFLPRLFTLAAMSTKAFDETLTSTMSFLIPKTAVAIILAIFFITQFQLYMASDTALLSLGYTNSQQTREVFAQLCVVCGIILGLLYADKRRDRLAQILSLLLLLETAFLNGMALKSVYDYSSSWGLTQKRLYGFAGILWLFSVLGFYYYYYTRKKYHSWLIQSIVVITGVVLIGINLANFDYLIYNYAKSTTHSGIDHWYLSRLSPDSMSYKKHLTILMQKMDTGKNTQDLSKYISPAYNLLYSIENLRYKYTHLHPGSFNLSEYLMYREVKDLPIEKMRQVVDAKQHIYYNTAVPPAVIEQLPQPITPYP